MLNKIGRIKSIDYEGLIEELKVLDKKARTEKYWQNSLYSLRQIELAPRITISNCDDLLVPDGSGWDNSAEACLKTTMKEIEQIKQAEKHNELFNKLFEIKYLDDTYVAFLYSAANGTIIPRKFVEIEFAKNYDNFTVAQINNLLSGSEQLSDQNSISSYNDSTKSELSIKLEAQKKELKEAEAKADAELEAFRQEMRQKELALKEQHDRMLAEMNAKVNSMKDEIFILENNIFALRSYFGETFDLTQVMKGQNASSDIPLVIYQKFRYMDEDISRLAANSYFSVDQTDITALFSKYGEVFVNDFCPAERCITFFKASKDNKLFAYCKEEDCIEQFSYYHGNQIGLLLRNGENLWIAFIDEEITLKDNLFLTEAAAYSEEAIEVKEGEELSVRDERLRPGLARKHIFLILDAILRLTSIYSDLKNQSVQNNPKIIFSSADKQIETFKYPTFKEFFKKSLPEDISYKQGDFIFIDEDHAGSFYNKWIGGEDHRSVGYRNTTRDADLRKGINRLNLIEYEDNGWLYKETEDDPYWHHEISGTVVDKYPIIKKDITTKYFVSCKRDIWWDGKDKHNNANVRVYSDEFMSLMWLNSNYIQQWIDAKQVPDKNYTYYIKMLKELRDFLRQREQNEFLLINAYIKFDNTPENRDKLLEWRIKNAVRTFTEYQAKRFVKTLM